MNIINFPKKIFLSFLFPISYFLFHFTDRIPDFIEKYYSKGINKYFIECISRFTGLFPFSIAEVFLIILSFFVPVLLLYIIFKIIKYDRNKFKSILNLILNITIIIGIVYFILTITWSLNYNRLQFSDIAGLKVSKASISELNNLCSNLVSKANKLRTEVPENSEGLMFLSGSYKEVFKNSERGFEIISETIPALSGKYGNPKRVLMSKGMSYTGIIGLYCPFTGEANIDTDIPEFSIPFTVCHEVAHQHGFAREDEANYIAWLACKANPDLSFKYSGTMLALINSTNALYGHDKDKYFQIVKGLSPGVKKDLNSNNLYWKKHKGPVEKATTSLNNAYLKANRQKDGVYSYGRMVDLLLAENRKEPIK